MTTIEVARTPADQEARDAIRHQLDVTMLVEAAAGTGKTTNLVERMLNLVRRGKASPATIAAITFTVKAAAHLRERFQEGLEAAIRKGGSADEVARLRDALGAIDRGFIGTTHAFCARLLRERPVEAGLDPEFEEMDEAEAERMSIAFWNRWFDAQTAIGSPVIDEGRRLGLDRLVLRPSFRKLIEYPDVWMIAARTEQPDLRSACDRLSRLLDEIEPHLPGDGDRDEPDDFEILIVNLLRRRDAIDLTDVVDQLEFLKEANHASRKPVQKRWPDGPTARDLGIRFVDFVTNTIRPLLQRWCEHVHGVAMEILIPAARAYEAERRHEATLTYQDLLTCARDLLRDHPHVRRYFQRRFTHVLVDEFQDTDPLQAEVLFYLTGEETSDRNWKALKPRPGSLFIVGDPKQSIYRFRRADITTYLDVKERIEAAGGKIVQLSTNFRSAASICAFVNQSFRAMFSAADVAERRQAAHVDLEPFRAVTTTNGVFILETQKGRNDDMAAAEARCVAQWIRRAVDSRMPVADDGEARPVAWSDVLLVSWQRPRLSFYAAALEEAGVPYQITGSNAFDELAPLATAMPLLRAIADPDDVLSIAGFLRGPLCGADDDALYRFVRANGAFSPFRDPRAGADERIARGLATIREGIEDARIQPPAAAIARLFDRIGLTALAATGERGGTASGNLLLALSIARDDSARGASFPAIVEHLGELLETAPDIGELDVDPSTANAVRLMNLHQVKGLEAPVVFLIDPADEFDFPVDLHVDRSGEESLGSMAITRPKAYATTEDIAVPVGWSAMKQVESLFKEAEKKRLLYVAATRAKNLLVIGFHQSSKGMRGAWRDLAQRVSARLFDLPEAGEPRVETPRDGDDFQQAAEAIAAKFEAAREASYSVLPVTKIAHNSHAELVRAEEGLGKGTSWGRVLHRLFEAMLRDESLDIRLHAANLLKDEERDAAELSEVLRVVEAVQSSPLWQRVKAAAERYVEVPFALMVPRRDLGIEEDGETLLHGTIDLAFREGGRWFVIDYKTDSTAGRIESLVKYYAPQVEHYARFWSRLTGAETSGGLFFVDGCIEEWVT